MSDEESSILLGDGNRAKVGDKITHKLWEDGGIVFKVVRIYAEGGLLICDSVSGSLLGLDFSPEFCSICLSPASTKDEFRKTYKVGKPKMHLVHWRGVEEVAYVREWGNEKHGGDNMHLTENEDLIDAIARHAAKLFRGELIDPESGRHHAAHIATNALYLVERWKMEEEKKK